MNMENNVDEPFQFSTNRVAKLSKYIDNRARVRDDKVHQQLKAYLSENLWENFR